jgi:predicted SAM-dependent methyltransferase
MAIPVHDHAAGADLHIGDEVTILHVGCGRNKTPASIGMQMKRRDGSDYTGTVRWINLDGNPDVQPDIVCVLGRDRIALDDNSVDLVVAHHVIEHIGEIGKVAEWFFFWEDLYRVLKHGPIPHTSERSRNTRSSISIRTPTKWAGRFPTTGHRSISC